MELVQGEKSQLTARQKTDMILDAVFGYQELEPFSVFNDGKEGTGKVYFNIHTCLSGLNAVQLPFEWQADVGEEKVTISF